MSQRDNEPELKLHPLDLDDCTHQFQRFAVVLAGLDIGLFDVLSKQPLTVSHLADALGIPAGRLRTVTEALRNLNYLIADSSDPPRLSCHDEARRYLSSDSPESRAREVRRLVRLVRGWSWLGEVVRHDQPRFVGSLATTGSPSAVTQQSLAQRGRRFGKLVCQRLPLDQCSSALDLGGGLGGYTMALLDARPELEVTLFDRPEVVQAAARALAHEGFTDSITYVGGDMMGPLPSGPFDLVLLANVLHLFSPAVASDLIARTSHLVAPGGHLVVRDSMLAPDGGPEAAVLFAIHMAIFSDRPRLYSTDDVAEMMRDVGLSPQEAFRPSPDQEGAIIIASRP
jgi:predicted O-methyltransferase YrrM